MRALLLLLSMLLGLMVAPLLHGDTVVRSLPDYISELEQLREKLSVPKLAPSEADAIADKLPLTFRVLVDSQDFTVPVEQIANDLRKFARSADASVLDQARRRVDLLLADARGMKAERTASAPERAKLNEILGRREFRDVAGESWWDRLKRRVQQWLWDALGAMVSSPRFPVIGRVLLWTVIAVSLALLVYWVVRNYRESATFTSLAGVPGAISERPWRDWQAEARLAAQQRRWRDAIHLSYWAGISFLEGQGLWRPDRARTPREYLQLLPADDTHRGSLAELTHKFETVWYGTEVANEQSFAATSDLLERLGCR